MTELMDMIDRKITDVRARHGDAVADFFNGVSRHVFLTHNLVAVIGDGDPIKQTIATHFIAEISADYTALLGEKYLPHATPHEIKAYVEEAISFADSLVKARRKIFH